jgi:hypothetical protein
MRRKAQRWSLILVAIIVVGGQPYVFNAPKGEFFSSMSNGEVAKEAPLMGKPSWKLSFLGAFYHLLQMGALHATLGHNYCT